MAITFVAYIPALKGRFVWESWQDYAVEALGTVLRLAKELGVEQQLHLWPDKSLGGKSLMARTENPRKFLKRLDHWWHRVSEWPE